MRAPVERADHADAAQSLAEHQVQPVDLELHRLRERRRSAHDQAEHDRHRRHRGDQDPGQLRVLREREDHAADCHHGRRDHHGQHHDQHLLNLRGVVRRARHQGRGTEAVELMDREMLDTGEDRTAQNPSEPGRHLRREKAAGDGAQGGHDRHQQHQAADFENRPLVALDDPLVDDVRHEPRQKEEADRLREGKDQDNRDVSAIGLDQSKQFQHRRSRLRTVRFAVDWVVGGDSNVT